MHSAYHYAVQCYNYQSLSPVLKLLLRFRVEGKNRIPDGVAALRYSFAMADVGTVQLLLAKGASVFTSDTNGIKLLHYAAGLVAPALYNSYVLQARMEIIELLLHRGLKCQMILSRTYCT